MDKIIKDKIHDYSGSYSDDLWSKIEAELHPVHDKKRYFGWYIFSATTLILAVGLAIYLNKSKSKPSVSQSTVVSDKKIDRSTETIFDAEYESDKNTEENISPETEERIVLVADDTNSTREENIIESVIEKNTISDIINTHLLNESEIQVSESRALSNISSLSINQFGYKKYISSSESSKQLKQLSREIALMRTECPSFHKEVAGVFLDLYFSHEYAFRRLNKQSDSDAVSDYLQKRDETEKSLYSFSTGIRVSLMLPNNFGLKTGINYSQINEKFEYVDPESIKEKIIQITEYTYENGVAVDSTFKLDTIEVGGEEKLRVYNKYRTLDIPLLFSYEWAGKHGFYFSSNAGVLMNFAFNQRGRILEPTSLKPQWFSSSLPDRYDAFESSLGISLYGSLGMYYTINKYFDFMLEPNLRVNLGSMTLGSHPVSQKYIVPGLITGVRVKF